MAVALKLGFENSNIVDTSNIEGNLSLVCTSNRMLTDSCLVSL